MCEQGWRVLRIWEHELWHKSENGSFDEFTERCFEFVGRFTQAGSGILDMITRGKQAGLPAPEFRQEGGQFVQRLWRPNPAVTPQVTPAVTPAVTPQVDSGSNPWQKLTANGR